MDAQNKKRGNDSILVPGAQDALDKLKYETADELSIDVPKDGDWGEITSRNCGKVGGEMVRKMIQMAEGQMKNQK